MNSNHKTTYSFLLLLLFSFFSFAQQTKNKNVELVKKQNGKRLEFYAKNNDSVSYSIFLRIETKDYRRSSNRPVLKVIPANSEKHLITLIKLTDKVGDYNEQFIVNEISQNLSFRKDFDDFQINIDDALKTEDITIFESENCALCNDAKNLFNDYQIAFKTKDIKAHQQELEQLLKHTEQTTDVIKNATFILKIKASIYTNITTKTALIDTINNYNK
ncbi:glutaredoxin domain-containing protein [Algibacter miyuki]|uniref:Glutaredoxin domain-containing protein n=1 Tax=Algibacter miyuki TaxID=1306933 RepID=A0ABV5H1N4_9FLAO|nr:glutaredoxin domain-containing protein [Algibacter miyuki]MDN3666424.1 glutaredoxin domain-containing protein [Algibacter miyuki]